MKIVRTNKDETILRLQELSKGDVFFIVSAGFVEGRRGATLEIDAYRDPIYIMTDIGSFNTIACVNLINGEVVNCNKITYVVKVNGAFVKDYQSEIKNAST